MRRPWPTCSRESQSQSRTSSSHSSRSRAASWTSCLLSQSLVRSVARPPPSTDDVQRFVEEYVRTHTITARFRWQPHHEQQLQAAAVGFNPPMRDVVSVLKKKVMVYVRGLAEQDAAGEDVSIVG